VKANQAVHDVTKLCRAVGVSPSGFYAWCARKPSPRATADAKVTTQICAIHERARGTYGVPRVHAELVADGICIGKNRVAKLMRRANLVGISPRKPRYTTVRNPDATPCADLVRRDFTASGPDKLWVADITYA
jgi:putative transposase